MTDGTPHRVAILGAGIGELHMDGWLAQGDAVEVRVVCELDAARGAALAARAPGCVVSADLDAVLADPDIDIISNCLPPHRHVDVTLAALAAGKHVVCEKPMATSVVEAEQLVAAALSAERLLVPVFQYRFGLGFYQMQALVERGVAGKPLVANIETHWHRDSAYYAVDWRGTWVGECGGALVGHAIHAHDLVSHCFDEVTGLSAFIDTRVNDIETEDCAAIAMRTARGALVTSSVTLGAANDETRLRFVYDQLTVESARVPFAPGEAEWTFTAREPTPQSAVDAVLAELDDNLRAQPQGFPGQFRALVRHLAGEGAPLVTAADGLRSIETVTALYHSARTGERVSLPLAVDHPLRRGWRPQAG